METKKRFFSGHAKSSAAAVSLAIHAILIIVAFSFVAVRVITKPEQSFEVKPVNRPKMQLKKLQVPVDIQKKKTQAPKLRKRIVVKPKLNQKAPDIKMPEITGVKGGMGSAGDGLGGGGGLGFAMPEIKIFGIKGKGEKIVLILGAEDDMMLDKMGGIAAFTIIKNEMIRIIEELPPTALFNVLIYEKGSVTAAFSELVPATDENAQKMKEWITPLNAVSKGMGDRDYGLHTLGQGGVRKKPTLVGKFDDTKQVGGVAKPDIRAWSRPVMIAHEMQADTIFVLTDKWDYQRVQSSGARMTREEWNQTSPGKKWNEAYKKALKTLDEENRKRRAAGQPPKVIGRGEWDMGREYYPNIQRPPTGGYYHYTAKDFVQNFLLIREQNKSASTQTKSGIARKTGGRVDFSLNVVQFVPQGSGQGKTEKFNQLTRLSKGDYKTISGLEEIQSYVTAGP
jgi:hypothetical protein